MFQQEELIVWYFLVPWRKEKKSVATNNNEVEKHMVFT